jgi:hypothetical protein
MADNNTKTSPVPEKPLSRDALLEITSGVIQDLRSKCISGRFRDPDNERMRDAKTRLLIQGIQAYGGLLKDMELDNLEKRIAELEAANTVGGKHD